MKRTNATIAVLLVSILTGAIPAGAQEQAASVVGSWDGLKALAAKEVLVVMLKDGGKKKGKLNDVTDTALVISEGKKTSELGRDSIFQVYRSISKSRGKATAIGASVGGGLGLLSGLFGDSNSGHGASGGVVAAGVIVMAGVGALIGRGIASGHEQVLIYQARR